MTDHRPPGALKGLLVSQFFGVFNDNAWKLIVVALAERLIDLGPALDGAARAAASQKKTMLAFVVFTLPLTLFSLPAGALADRVSKRAIVIALKLLECALMIAAAGVLFFSPGNQAAALTILGLMGLQSALFSPAKYGLLPELVGHRDLAQANGAIELWTFAAIILGTAAGPALLAFSGGAPWIAGIVLAVFAVIGTIASLAIPRVPAANGGVAFGAAISAGRRALTADRALWLATIGSTWFWFTSSLMGQNLVVYSKVVLGLSEKFSGLPLCLFGIGVGAGAALAGRVSAKKIETGLIPLGAFGLGLGALAFGIAAPGVSGTCAWMAILGILSGLLIVPLDALIQWRAPASARGAVIALSNVAVFGGMFFGSIAGWLFAEMHLSVRGIMIAAACATLGGAIFAVKILPEAGLRMLVFIATRTFYRLRIVGRESVPETGGALLTPNHVSFMDGLFLLAALDRPVRFIVDQGQFDRPLVRPFLRVLGAIPVSATGGPRGILRALRDAGKYLEAGELVCIFPEGQITRTGAMQPFRRGLERIAKGRPAPIIPVHLDRVWGSIFSFAKGRFTTKLPEEVPYPVTVTFGAPLAPDTPIAVIRDAVATLGERAWYDRKKDRRPLADTFVRVMRRRPFAFAAADRRSGAVSRLGLATRAYAIAKALARRGVRDERIGILFPPSTAGAIVNLAALFAGRTAVNLNFTAGPALVLSAIRQAKITRVITGREVIARFPDLLPTEVERIFVEDLVPEIGFFDRIAAALIALLFPAGWRARWAGGSLRAMDDTATIVFSSGSTGDPKGVILSHFNLDSNVEAVSQVFRIGPDDRMLGILPLFHSFGFMTLWVALNRGMPIIFHANPLDAAGIGEIVNRHAITMMLATPTFLGIYARRTPPELFGSLRMVLAGAEKLTERAAIAFEERFGIRPLEGYGATECAPVIATSIPSFRAPGFFQPGSRRGYVGLPVPGVTVRIVDPETLSPLQPNTSGMLLVRGPNVTSGYLDRPDLTEKAFKDGWYVTGDLAEIDDDGFLKINDRLSRFSKIGGEMVPHGRVEEALVDAWGRPTPPSAFAVAGVPDEKKGERLAVLTTVPAAEVPGLLARLAAAGLPNLFIPRADAFVHTDAIPVLGTGKTDLRAVKAKIIDGMKPGDPAV